MLKAEIQNPRLGSTTENDDVRSASVFPDDCKITLISRCNIPFNLILGVILLEITISGCINQSFLLWTCYLFNFYPVSCFFFFFFSSTSSSISSFICLSPLRCRAASWPKSLSAGTSVCSPWCCAFPEMLLWSRNQLGASHLMILPSLPCVRSLEVGRQTQLDRINFKYVAQNLDWFREHG